MQVNSYRIFTTPEGQRVDTNRNLHPDATDPILVRSTNDGWTPARVEGQVNHDTMAKDFGFWRDQQLSHEEGWWNPKEVIDRPLDGKVQPDEVELASPERVGNSNTFYLGAEIAQDAEGRQFLTERHLSWGPLAIIGPN